MKATLLAVLLAAAGTAHAYTVDLTTYRYVMKPTATRPAMVVGITACKAKGPPGHETGWSRGATLHTDPVTGAQFETPGCWKLNEISGVYCMVDTKTNTVAAACEGFDPKALIDAATLPRRAF